MYSGKQCQRKLNILNIDNLLPHSFRSQKYLVDIEMSAFLIEQFCVDYVRMNLRITRAVVRIGDACVKIMAAK